jgi:hypothetical protein
MTKPPLRIAKRLTLSLHVVTAVVAFLRRRGQGKSYAAQKPAEEFHLVHAQFVALDPVSN